VPAGVLLVSTFLYVNGYYIAIGSRYGSGIVFYSTTYESNWIEVPITTPFYNLPLNSTYVYGAYGLGIIVLVGGHYMLNDSTQGGFYWSSDITSNYTYVSTPGFLSNGSGVDFDGTKFVAIGQNIPRDLPTISNESFRVSYDGKSWSKAGFSGDLTWSDPWTVGIKYAWMNNLNLGMWLATSGGSVKYSYDGMAWNNFTAASGIKLDTSYRRISWTGARWVIGIVHSSISYQYSFNGLMWYNIYIAKVNTGTSNYTFGNSFYAKEYTLTDIVATSSSATYTGSPIIVTASSAILGLSANKEYYYKDSGGNTLSSISLAGLYSVTAV
jgi:hypothetical protein